MEALPISVRLSLSLPVIGRTEFLGWTTQAKHTETFENCQVKDNSSFLIIVSQITGVETIVLLYFMFTSNTRIIFSSLTELRGK